MYLNASGKLITESLRDYSKTTLRDTEALRTITGRTSHPSFAPPRNTTSHDPAELGLGDEATSMRVLSIRQPFAEAILRGTKTSEFRSGPTSIRGRILVYASLGRFNDDEETEMLREFDLTDVESDDLPRGVIVGSVELYDCDSEEWLLRDPRRARKYVEPVNRPNPVWFFPF